MTASKERGSLTRRQLGEKSAIEVVVGKSYHHPRRRKDGRMEHSDRLVLITFGLLSSGEGREGDVSPAVFVSGDEISSTGASAASAVAVGRSATENRSIDRHR